MTELQLPATAPASGASESLSVEGMHRAGARPSLGAYIGQLWERRHFIASYTRANNEIMYSRSFLGQLWQLLTPLLNAAVYYMVFGLLLHTRRGIHNFVAFLVIGIFVFHFLTQSIVRGARSVSNNQGLIRSLHFPRAALPISSTAQTGIQLLVSMAVLIPIVIVTGETPTLHWLLIIPVLFLAVMFGLGAALAIARVSAHIPDTTALLPFILRTWLYCSGIFYNIEVMAKHRPTVRMLLHLNPGAEYVELARSALIQGYPCPIYLWWLAIGWAVVVLIVGTIFFWRAEETYARG